MPAIIYGVRLFITSLGIANFSQSALSWRYDTHPHLFTAWYLFFIYLACIFLAWPYQPLLYFIMSSYFLLYVGCIHILNQKFWFNNMFKVNSLPLGNLTSQLLVNIYMNEFDQYVKHQLNVKYYIRYADDLVFLSHNKKYLRLILHSIEVCFQTQLKLKLHPNKVSITTVASGVDFLGWVQFPYHCILRRVTRRRIMSRLKNEEASEAARQSYLGLLRHGNTYGLIRAARKDRMTQVD